MKYIIIILLHLAVIPSVMAQDGQATYPFKGEYAFDSGGCDLAAEIAIDSPELKPGDLYSIEYTIKTGGHCPLYNPFFNGLLPPSAHLAIYDEEKKYVMNSTRRIAGSERRPERSDWLIMHSGFIGSKLSFPAGDSCLGLPTTPLKEGNYYLQMIFYKSFYSSPWEDFSPPQDQSYFYKHYSTAELFRSNVLKIKIVRGK